MSLSRDLWRVMPSAWVWAALTLAFCLPLAILGVTVIDPEVRNHLDTLPGTAILAVALILFLPLIALLAHLFRRERVLASHAQALAGLIDQAADMLLVCRLDGRIVEINAPTQALLGLSREKLRSMSFFDLDPDSALRQHPELRAALANGETVSYDTSLQTHHGQRAVEPQITLTDWGGQPHYLILIRDITERKQTESQLTALAQDLEQARDRMESRVEERTRELSESFAALSRQTRDRLKAEQDLTRVRLLLNNIVESMPSALIAVDLNSCVTEWNREAERLSGIPRDDAIGRRIERVLPNFLPLLQRIRDILAEGAAQHSERINTRVNDQVRILDLVVFPLIADQGKGVVIRADDVTEKVRVEEMLVQTEKILSLGGLAAGMAHEINNPLGGILQSGQNIQRRLDFSRERNRQLAADCRLDVGALQQYLDTQRIGHFLEGIQEAGARAAAIVADTLSFARGASQEAVPIDPAEALDSAVRLAGNFNPRARFDFRRIEIQREFLPAGRVLAQKTKLEQVFLNLLVNAAHALAARPGDDTPRIVLRIAREDGFVRIDVIDNGPGMSDEVRRRVFEPFFTTKEEGSGTGLGLSVSFFIVTEQLKGRIEVESTPGHGAHFILRLPSVAESQETLVEPHEEQIELPLGS